jgi:signal transduction histidine kinase
MIVAIVPLYLVMEFAPDYGIWVLIAVVLACIAVIVIFVFVNRRQIVLPIRAMIKGSRKITKGEYVKLETKTADSDLNELIISLNNTAYEFENLEQMRKSFVSNASHELRSPLTSIQGFLQAILDGTIGPEDQDKYLKIVFRETKRLSSLINSMLDLSRMESGKNPLAPSRFELNTVIKQVVERFEPNLIKRECQLDVDFVRDFSYVYADKDKIIQVLINLIDNAIKYSPTHSRILVTTHLHGKKIYVSIKDNGFGISKKDQMLIWDRFYMADKAHTPTKNKGTGLGLSIVKKIMDEHKEVIWVESNKGAGSTFIFTLALFDPNKHKVEDKVLTSARKA